jgi:hypothetical protein
MIFDKFIASASVVAGAPGDARIAVNTYQQAWLGRRESGGRRRHSGTRAGCSQTAMERAVICGFTAALFPRLKSRGPIEAGVCLQPSHHCVVFPRLKSRGPIEAVVFASCGG